MNTVSFSISQIGIDAPSLVVYESVAGITSADMAYVGVGEYSLTKQGAFCGEMASAQHQMKGEGWGGNSYSIKIKQFSDDEIRIYCFDGDGNPSDEQLSNKFIEMKFY